ncbi:MAG: DOMON-like domain-containing protein, partial [Caulobacteraceae bacterium]
ARPATLALTFLVTGAIADLHWPPIAAPSRAEGLWRRTCFEAFVRPLSGTGYFEFNLSPSTRWAAYRFEDYRGGMRLAGGFGPPAMTARAGAEHGEVEVVLNLDLLPDLPGEAPWRVGLAAVIEEASGRRSYWALAHPPGRPDFHHADGFALELAPERR